MGRLRSTKAPPDSISTREQKRPESPSPRSQTYIRNQPASAPSVVGENLLQFGFTLREGDNDGLLIAERLTELASDTFLFMHPGDHLDIVPALDALQADAVEGADLHTVVAPVAELRDDLGLWHVLGADARDDLSKFVQDAFDRTVAAAHVAVDAKGGGDDEEVIFASSNGVGRALNLTDPTTDTGICDEMCPLTPPVAN